MSITLNGTTGVTTTGLTSNGIDDNATSTAITIDASENVGIGTSPSARLHVDNGNGSALYVGLANNIYSRGTEHIWQSQNNASEYMRIDSSGNVLVGKTSSDAGVTAGSEFQSSGLNYITRTGTPMVVNRLGSNGDVLAFRKDGTTVGSIGASSGVLYIDGPSGNGISLPNNAVLPATSGGARDNQTDLGVSYARFDDIFATNGTIQTSDRNEKQDVAALTATEMLVAARISGLFKTFRWIDSVADKGENARTHTGVIAQDVQAAFIAEGLDSGDYALFTSATWWETQTDVPAVEADEDNEIEAADAYTRTDTFDTLDEAPDGATERTRMGIRYPELLAFVGAYNEQRFASIETRLAVLEAV